MSEPRVDVTPADILNRICFELGLFDGARTESPSNVLHGEILPMIRALKANNPEAAAVIHELQRVRSLWIDALARLANARASKAKLAEKEHS